MKDLSKKTDNQNPSELNADGELPGYPAYPKSQDVYNKFKEESDIDPENTSMKKQSIQTMKFLRKKISSQTQLALIWMFPALN